MTTALQQSTNKPVANILDKNKIIIKGEIDGEVLQKLSDAISESSHWIFFADDASVNLSFFNKKVDNKLKVPGRIQVVCADNGPKLILMIFFVALQILNKNEGNEKQQQALLDRLSKRFIIVLDEEMPPLSGRDVATRIRTLKAETLLNSNQLIEVLKVSDHLNSGELLRGLSIDGLLEGIDEGDTANKIVKLCRGLPIFSYSANVSLKRENLSRSLARELEKPLNNSSSSPVLSPAATPPFSSPSPERKTKAKRFERIRRSFHGLHSLFSKSMGSKAIGEDTNSSNSPSPAATPSASRKSSRTSDDACFGGMSGLISSDTTPSTTPSSSPQTSPAATPASLSRRTSSASDGMVNLDSLNGEILNEELLFDDSFYKSGGDDSIFEEIAKRFEAQYISPGSKA